MARVALTEVRLGVPYGLMRNEVGFVGPAYLAQSGNLTEDAVERLHRSRLPHTNAVSGTFCKPGLPLHDGNPRSAVPH
jgi:hypothetical protein